MTLALLHERKMLDQNLSCQVTALRVVHKTNIVDNNKRPKLASCIEKRSKDYTTHIKIRTDRGFELVDVKMIAYCQADGNYTKVYLQDGQSYLISYSIKHVCRDLSPALILRVHQSYALNINCISRAILSGSDMIELNCGTNIPIARRRKKYVKNMLQFRF